jgi:hypothetical protein
VTACPASESGFKSFGSQVRAQHGYPEFSNACMDLQICERDVLAFVPETAWHTVRLSTALSEVFLSA